MSRDSKLLALILRHGPGSVGLRLDRGGWVGIDMLAEALGRHGHPIGHDDILAVAASSDKARFTVFPDGARIRAAQGHSVDVNLGLAPAEPPEVLFHGTAEGAVAAILAEGLRPMARRHVHRSGTCRATRPQRPGSASATAAPWCCAWPRGRCATTA